MSVKTTMGLKLENVPGTVETLTAADYGYRWYDISVTPEIAEYARKIARGDMSWDPNIAGKEKVTFRMSVDVHPGGDGSVAVCPPRYFTALRCTKMKQTTHGATGVSLATHADEDRTTCTIEWAAKQEGASPKQLIIRGRGCAGKKRIIQSEVGRPAKVEFEFLGVLDWIGTRANASILTPASYDTAQSDATRGATINLFGTVQLFEEFTVDDNNVLELFTDPAKSEGYDACRVADGHPTIEIDPDLLVTDDVDWHSRVTSNTTGAFSGVMGKNMTLSAPAAQRVGNPANPGERQGHLTDQIRLECQRSSGNDELELLQGSKT
jgi:hypothetical protein